MTFCALRIYFRQKIQNYKNCVIMILLQQFAFFYSWSPTDVSRTQGSAGICSLVAIFHDLEHPTFANFWQSCHILALLSISFSVFLFLSNQILSVVPLPRLFLYPFVPHAPTSFLTNYTNCVVYIRRKITYKNPWKGGRSFILQISSHDLSLSQDESGFGRLFSKPTPPVKKNMNSSWLKSPFALKMRLGAKV